jgi:ribosomal protein L37AE/L43A
MPREEGSDAAWLREVRETLAVDAVSRPDRHDCPACRATLLQMIVNDRSRTVLRCMHCGGSFDVPRVRDSDSEVS